MKPVPAAFSILRQGKLQRALQKPLGQDMLSVNAAPASVTVPVDYMYQSGPRSSLGGCHSLSRIRGRDVLTECLCIIREHLKKVNLNPS